MEYIIILVIGLIFVADLIFNFLSKSVTLILLVPLFLAILHMIVKDAVIKAIKEERE